MDPVVRFANSRQESLGTPVGSLGDNQRNALIAETAFLLAGSEFAGHVYQKIDLESKAREFLLNLPRGAAAGALLSSDEWLEVGLLAQVTQRYTSRLSAPAFSPEIPGCGVVDAAIADLLAEQEIVEVKTVTRPFRSYDLRQALTYAAMLYAAGRPVERITLLNPRRARSVTMSIAELAAGTRGDSSGELMQDLVEWMVGLQVSA
jgi:hypothetical protein